MFGRSDREAAKALWQHEADEAADHACYCDHSFEVENESLALASTWFVCLSHARDPAP